MSKTLLLSGQVRQGPFALDVDETIELDGIVAVFGPNGSGKTTLLRSIAGLTCCAAFRVSFDGMQWQDAHGFVPVHRRRIGYVFQDGRLFTHLSVKRNIEYSARFSERRGDISYGAVVDALALAPLLERQIYSLSGGEAQRVALGRALLSNPRLLLMDEPLSSLDLERKREVIEYIASIPRLFGVPIIYVTHDADEVARLARTTLLLSAGRVVAHGSTSDVFATREWSSVFGYGDACSILQGTVEECGAPLGSVRVGTRRLKVPHVKESVGSPVQIRVRARDVVIATQAPSKVSIRNSLPCRIAAIGDLDALHTELLLEAEGQTLRALVTREAVEDLQLVSGSSVYALIKSVAFDTAL